MFKASLIEDHRYYELKKRLLMIGLPGVILLEILSQFFAVTPFRFALYAGLAVLIIYYVWLTKRELDQVVSDKKLEIDNQKILIKRKSGELLETIKLDEVNKIEVKEQYSIQEDDLMGTVKQLKTEIKQDFIVLHTSHGQRQINFTLDSYYMTEQLKKVIANWKKSGLAIELK